MIATKIDLIDICGKFSKLYENKVFKKFSKFESFFKEKYSVSSSFTIGFMTAIAILNDSNSLSLDNCTLEQLRLAEKNISELIGLVEK